LGCDHVTVERWSEVVVDVLSDIVPFGFGGSCSELEVVADHTFGLFDGVEIVVNIVISTEVGNSVIDVVSEALFLVLVLSATGR